MSDRLTVIVRPRAVGYTVRVLDLDEQVARTWVPFADLANPVAGLLHRRWQHKKRISNAVSVNSPVLYERDMQWAERVVRGTSGVRVTRPRLEGWSKMHGYGVGGSVHIYGPGDDNKKPNLYVSKQPDDTHLPVIDLDYGAQLVPSRTDGHWHLYLEKSVSWDQYKKVLVALAEAELIEPNYAKHSIDRGMTAVRIPPMELIADEKSDEMEAMLEDIQKKPAPVPEWVDF